LKPVSFVNGELEHKYVYKSNVGVLYSRYHGSPITTQKSGYDRFPPAAHGWGTNHPIPDKASPLLVEKDQDVPGLLGAMPGGFQHRITTNGTWSSGSGYI
jgi:hypothetical protein